MRTLLMGLGAATLVATGIVVGYCAGPEPGDSAKSIEGTRLTGARLDKLGPEEQKIYTAYRLKLTQWRKGELSGKEMNEFLGWDSRKLKARWVVVKDQLPLGEPLQCALVLENRAERPQIVFPFRLRRATGTGHMEDGVRTSEFVMTETPGTGEYLSIVPPGDKLVVPFTLDPQPVGKYKVRLAAALWSFSDSPQWPGMRTFDPVNILPFEARVFEIVESESR